MLSWGAPREPGAEIYWGASPGLQGHSHPRPVVLPGAPTRPHPSCDLGNQPCWGSASQEPLSRPSPQHSGSDVPPTEPHSSLAPPFRIGSRALHEAEVRPQGATGFQTCSGDPRGRLTAGRPGSRGARLGGSGEIIRRQKEVGDQHCTPRWDPGTQRQEGSKHTRLVSPAVWEGNSLFLQGGRGVVRGGTMLLRAGVYPGSGGVAWGTGVYLGERGCSLGNRNLTWGMGSILGSRGIG